MRYITFLSETIAFREVRSQVREVEEGLGKKRENSIVTSSLTQTIDLHNLLRRRLDVHSNVQYLMYCIDVLLSVVK